MNKYKIFNVLILLVSGLFLILSTRLGIVCIIISSILLIFWAMLFIQKNKINK